MTNPIILITTFIIAVLLFLFFIVTGILRKSIFRILFSLVFVAIAFGSLFFIGVYAASKASSKVAKTIHDVKENFKPRTGEEIYNALFGKPVDDCIKVINQKDQIVPRLDCCIWIEFKTCPSELNRIIKQQPFAVNKYHAADTMNYVPSYSPRPGWWKPDVLGDSVYILRSFNFDDPNHDKILIIAKDSSHAFYCDMAD